ncbi:unnamed protein product, partial [Ixodes pacificus]
MSRIRGQRCCPAWHKRSWTPRWTRHCDVMKSYILEGSFRNLIIAAETRQQATEGASRGLVIAVRKFVCFLHRCCDD